MKDQREDKLPVWARELLANLRQQLEAERRKVKGLEHESKVYYARNEALNELLDCAAKGGHKTAQTIVDMIKVYFPNEQTTMKLTM